MNKTILEGMKAKTTITEPISNRLAGTFVNKSERKHSFKNSSLNTKGFDTLKKN